MARTVLCSGTLALGLGVAAIAQAADTLAVGETHFGTNIFLDATHIDQSVGGVRDAGQSGSGVDLKRAFFIADHRFSEVWSAHLITDVQWVRHQDPGDLWVRNAYLQAAFSPVFDLKLGASNTPWIALASKWYGFRYVEAGLLSRAKVGSVADWGVHASGRFGPQQSFSYAAAVITGASYKEPRIGNGPDAVALVAWQPVSHLLLALGGYDGKVGENGDGRPDLHTARRYNAMVAWADARFRLGGQYFRANNWNRISSPLGDSSHGWSAWTSVQLSPRLTVFARHDRFTPSRLLDPTRRDRYSNAGIQWQAAKWIKLAAVYKHQRLTRAGTELKGGNEVGLWSQISF